MSACSQLSLKYDSVLEPIEYVFTTDTFIFYEIAHQVLNDAEIHYDNASMSPTKEPRYSVQFANDWLTFQLKGREFVVTFGDGSKVFDLGDPKSIEQITGFLKDLKARY